MAVISVPSSATGSAYSVRIAGDTPTAEEQARIDAYVAQMDARMSATSTAQAAEEEGGGLGSALGVGVDILQQGFGSAVEGFGTSTGLDFLRDYGASVAEANKQQVMEATPGLTGYEDVEDVGSALSFFGETLAQQVPQLGVSIGGGYAGSKLGGAIGTAIAPGVGTAAGAVIGGLAGSILANIPFFYGQNRERQKEVIESTGKDAEVSEGAAFLTSIPQAALDGIVDRLLIGKVIKPDVLSAGGIFTRAVKGAGAGSVVEAPTEIGQQLLERLQAGLPIDDDEAIEEYKQAAIVGGLIGGTVGGTVNVLGGDSRAAKKKKDDEAAAAQLEEDQREEAEAASKQIKFGERPVKAPEAEEDAVTGTLMLPAPTAGAAPQESLVTPTTEAPAQPQRKTVKFRWRDYTAAVQAVSGSGDASIPSIQKALSPDGKVQTAPSIAKAVRARMVADGVIAADKKAKGGYRVIPDAAPVVDPTESYQRTIDDLQKDIGDASLAREKAVQDARRAEQTGTKADARKFMLQADAAQKAIDTAEATRQEVEARLPSAAASAAVPSVEQPGSLIAEGKAAVPITEAPQPAQTVAVSNRTKRLKQALDYYQKEAAAKAAQVRQLRETGKKVQLPKSDVAKIARLEQEAATAVREAASIKTQLARPAQDIEQSRAQAAAARAKEASVAAERAARTPTYTEKEGQLFEALRRRLDNLGLSDVKLVAERVLRPQGSPENALIEGMMDVDRRNGNRIISLALGVYDPNMTQQELFDAISGVMNHEVIHALRSLGLFTDAEWKSLSDLAARQRYMKLKDGKSVERGYTYLQRAQGMYASSDPEIQVEEAVSEMFRDYVAGTLKIGGKPKTLMDRIKGFFRAMWKSHEDAGITDPNLIFEGVRFGDIGRRERKADAAPETDTRLSRVAAERAPSDPNYAKWSVGPNGERAIVDASGNPVVYYTGTSKDQDFTSFKVGRHGGWFVTDPESASGYALDNDSMGFRREGWDIVKTNTKPRVMPVFLRAANPFTGQMPESVVSDNYKRSQSIWFDTLRAQGYDAWMPSDQPGLMVALRDGDQVKSVFARGTGGKADMRRYSSIIATDNPGGEWLDGKRRRAENDMVSAPRGSSRSKGLGGSITAYMPKPINLPVDRLSALTGAEDEVRRSGDPRYDALAADVARRGFVPDQDGNAVVVGVNHLGQAYLLEGNTRVAVARDFGVPSVRAEVRWFNGGELADGPFSPAAVERLATEGGRDDVGRDESKDVRESRRLEAAIAASATGSPLEVAAQKYVARATAGNPEFGQLTPLDLDNITEEFFDRPGWAVITATDNTREGPFKESQNARAHEQLRADMEYAGIPYRVVEGMYKGEPDGISYMILADEPTARKLGMRYNQESILTSRGWVYAKRTLPRTIRTEGVYYGDEARQQDFFTDLGDGGAFSLNLDTEGSGPENPDIGPGFYTEDDRPQLPIRASDGLVELHHWSDKQLDVIDPAFAGTGPLKGDERGRGAKLAFFGINPRGDDLVQGTGYVKEPGLGNFEHIALVKPETLYPWELDPDGLATDLDKTSRKGTSEYERRIRDAGYKGYYTERVSPDTAPLGNVAALFDKVPVKPAREVKLALRNPPRYSMISGIKKPLTKSERKLTVLDRMDPVTAEFFSDGKTRSVMEALTDLNNPRKNVVIMPGDPDSVKTLARLMLAELRMALIRSPEAIGWYGTTLAKAKKVAALLHPEISPVNPYSGAKSNIYDPDAEHAWDLAMAITSNGMAVSENAKFANVQYEHWKETGQFLEEGTGDQGTGMVAAFRAYNAMKRTMTDDQIAEFLSRKMTVRELRNNPILKDIGIKVGSSESADTVINGSFIFGPKIGQGFYQNLRGNFDPLTMDLWFMRMFNRLTGRPFFEAKEKTLLENAERVAREANSDALSDYDKRVKRIAMESENIDIVTPENADRFAVAFDKIYQRDFKKFPDVAIAESGLNPKSREAKAIGKAARPVGSQLVLSSKRYRENLEISPQDAPRGPKDRAYMRAVVDQVKAALASDGIDISTADIQAVMWYAEKQLFAAMGVRQGKGGDNDYVDGAIELLRSKGIVDDEIARTLPEAERDRLRYRTAAERTAARVRGEPQPDVQGGGGSQDVPGATLGGGPSAAQGDGDQGGVNRRLSVRYAVSPITPAMQKKIQANQQSMLYARSADALAGLISKTRLVEADKAKKFTDGLMRRFQDSMLPIGRMVQELSAKGLTITDAMDTYLQENLMHGVVGERMRVNKAGLYEPVTKAIKRLNVPKARIDQLATASSAAAGGKGYVALSLETGDNPRLVLANAYLYAAHARERNRYIKANKDKANNSGSGMSDAEASAIMQWFASLDPANKAVIADLEKGIRLIVADTNQTRVDGGLLSSSVVDPYNFYVPLRGLMDQDDVTQEDNSPGNRTIPGFGARGREDRRATGRYDYATDIVANVFAQNSNAIVRAERNKVGQSFLKLLRSNPLMTGAYAKVLPYAPKIKVSRNGKMVEIPDPKAYDRPDILVVKEDGKETFVEFTDATTAGAMNGKNGLSIETGRGVLRFMGQLNRYLATINTSYNPEFVITNMIRDLIAGGIQINQFEMEGLTADALRGVPSALKGIAKSIRSNDNTSPWAKVYREFVEEGGQNSTNQMNSIADYTDDIASMLGDISQSGIRGKWSSVKNSLAGRGVGSVLNFLEEYNTIVENGIRVSTYKALIDRGVSKERAAQAARNVTVNFAKRGDYGQLMNAYSLFYNASIQGSFALLNAATRSKKVQKILLGVAASGFVLDAVNALISGEDEDGEKIYDKIPDHVLEHNLVLMDFLGVSDRGYITIPMPYGINLPFNIGRVITRTWRGGYDAGEAGQSLLSTLLDVVNPLGGNESFLNFAAPTILDPVVDMVENEDFANKPIYKEGLPFDKTPAPDSQMYWSTTSPSAIWMANTLNSLTGGNEVRPGLVDMSPDVIQFWFEFATGGLGRFAMNSAEVPFTLVEEGITAENIRNIPFVKKVVGSVSEREDMTSYIEGAKQILTAGDELKRARESGDAEWAKQTIGRYGAELRLVGPIKSIEGNLKKISKIKNEVNRNTSIPEAQKKVILDRLDERRQMLLSRANKLIKDAGL